jgi:hypothetical protein
MVMIDEVLMDDDVLTAKFACDIRVCKGACCTFPGEFGAPLLDLELPILEDYYPKIQKYLSGKSKKYIEKHGMFEGAKGARTTVCIDKRDCVFVYYENDLALCAYEKAFLEGEIPFRKPISCHLFPIRVKNFGGNFLHYVEIEECECARKRGDKENIPLYVSLEEALVRAYGEDWYSTLKNYIKESDLDNNTK